MLETMMFHQGALGATADTAQLPTTKEKRQHFN